MIADLLGQRQWTEDGYEVSCKKLTITPTAAPVVRGGAAEGPAEIRFQVRWDYELVGEDRQMGGNYIRSFFASIEASKFWKNHGMEGRPIDSYSGDKPEWDPDIERVLIEETLIVCTRRLSMEVSNEL